jgi:hypothetical protein
MLVIRPDQPINKFRGFITNLSKSRNTVYPMVGRERFGAMGMTGKYHEQEVKELRVSQTT